MTETAASSVDGQPTSLLRRLSAIIYDALLLIAIWMVLGLLVVVLGNTTGLYSPRAHFVLNLIVAWGFFYWFWTRTGQTLGMQAWNIQLRTEGGHAVHAWQATLRYLVAVAQWLVILMAIWAVREHGAVAITVVTAAALFALGLSQFHPRRWMLHDWLSSTELVRIQGLAKPRWKQNRKS
ncbi:RDD family protein [Thioalkalivibrio sp. ALMg11]|uniref:RDD family protein n=1 Tax=Thioalkalivibrio sp. ALMg11 TaxID=1158165 RepID=UPI000373CD81|nr:RDD family protein [Thioalkalivibrio sp. ALMg11]